MASTRLASSLVFDASLIFSSIGCVRLRACASGRKVVRHVGITLALFAVGLFFALVVPGVSLVWTVCGSSVRDGNLGRISTPFRAGWTHTPKSRVTCPASYPDSQHSTRLGAAVGPLLVSSSSSHCSLLLVFESRDHRPSVILERDTTDCLGFPVGLREAAALGRVALVVFFSGWGYYTIDRSSRGLVSPEATTPHHLPRRSAAANK